MMNGTQIADRKACGSSLKVIGAGANIGGSIENTATLYDCANY
jgi:hypothetical protein